MPRGMEQVEGFWVVERAYSDDSSLPTIGLANIEAVVPGIAENKAKVERASAVLKERGANIAIFPEFCLSGYFWEDKEACWAYMDRPSPTAISTGSTKACARSWTTTSGRSC